MSYPFFVAAGREQFDGTRTTTSYGLLDELTAAKYARHVHRWVWTHIKRPAENSWSLQLTANDPNARLRFLTYLFYDHMAQKFTFESGVWAGFQNPPLMFPDVKEHDWTCLLSEVFHDS